MDQLEKELKEVDLILMKLFQKRMKIVSKIADYKIRNNIAIQDKNREQVVIERSLQRLKNECDKKYIISFLQSMMKISKEMQEKMK
ncbi:chorismate mutase [Lutibacter sp. B2]|nr:chorismate mutase [Lutibacter sp. B2]